MIRYNFKCSLRPPHASPPLHGGVGMPRAACGGRNMKDQYRININQESMPQLRSIVGSHFTPYALQTGSIFL
jgi:hypothetical protein